MQQFNSPIEAFLYWENKTPQNTHFVQPTDGGTKTYTYQESGNEIRRMAGALKALGYPPQSKIGLLSKNCAHWVMSDLAILMAGHVSVPIYPTLGPDTIQHVLEHSESKAVILGKLDDYESQKAGIPDIKKISIGLYGMNDGESWEEMVAANEPLQAPEPTKPEDLITLIYTSGTTGAPKGAMHTVGNFNTMGHIVLDEFDMPEHSSFFSYLPLSHIAERIGVCIHSIYRGGSINFPESLDTFAADLAATQPHLFFAVPRIWSKFQEKILEKMPQKKLDRLLGIPIIGGIIKKKLKKALGLSRAKYIFSGAAPIAVSMLEWYQKLGIEILQGYGMTEDCINSHFCMPGANKMGTVGKPMKSITAKLSPAGEICIKNETLMKGYYKMPEKNEEVFDEEGYLRTGDIGEYDHEGYLTITGRVKDQFKTDKGKYISPAPIELELMKNPYIEQVCVVGTGIPQPIALIITPMESKSKSNEEVAKSIVATIKEINPTLEKHEKIEKAVIMSEDWTVENGLLTPTMKVKRNQVEKIHSGFYSDWFSRKDDVIFE
ncbi:MAG: AMP-binding protein [Cyclobacteriaceae bacterium]